MSNFKISIFVISIFILTFLGIKKFIYINQGKDLNNNEESALNESTHVLNECFDLENKNKRIIYKSNELIEYCMKEYRYKKWFQNFNDEFL